MNSDEYKMLSQEINELHERLDRHDKYLKEMTSALSLASVLLVVGFLNLYGVI